MKANQDFELVLDKKSGKRIPYRDGEAVEVTKLNIKKGEEVPAEFVHDLAMSNPEYLELEFKEGKYVMPKEEKAESNLSGGADLESPKKLTAVEIKALSKVKQTEFIKSLGGTEVPKTEKERIDLILKLQGN